MPKVACIFCPESKVLLDPATFIYKLTGFGENPRNAWEFKEL
jgi:hypothetical protein